MRGCVSYHHYHDYAPTQSRPDKSIFGWFCLQNGPLLGELPAKAYEPQPTQFEIRASFS